MGVLGGPRKSWEGLLRSKEDLLGPPRISLGASTISLGMARNQAKSKSKSNQNQPKSSRNPSQIKIKIEIEIEIEIRVNILVDKSKIQKRILIKNPDKNPGRILGVT